MAVLLFTFFSLTFLGVMAACACFSLISGRLLLRAGSLRLLFPYFRPTSFCVMAACACFFLVSGRLLLHAGSLRLLFLALDRFFTDFGQLDWISSFPRLNSKKKWETDTILCFPYNHTIHLMRIILSHHSLR